MKLIKIIAFCSVFAFFSCEKKKEQKIPEPVIITTDLKNGFPDNINAINGYFYATVRSWDYSINSYNIDAYAASIDPANNLFTAFDHYSDAQLFISSILAGNINLGMVSFNGFTLNISNFGNSVSYNLNNSNSLSAIPSQAKWKTEGNGSFKALDIEVTRGFPVIKTQDLNSSQTHSISINKGYEVNFANYISNYDSLVIRLEGFNGSWKTVRKNVTAGASSVYFSNFDLSIFNGFGSVTLSFNAFNYSNKIIENVSYLFELSNKFQAIVSVSP